MNRYIYNLAIACLALWTMAGCSAEEPPSAPVCDGPGTYTLRLIGSCTGFDSPTRATVEWADGDQVYIRFKDDAGQVDGTATYKAAQGEWTIDTKRRLISEEGSCQTLYFENPTSATATAVSLSPTSVSYADSLAAYHVEENVIMVRTAMTPLTGRIRFKGAAGQKCEVWGISYHHTYTFSTHAFTDKALQIATTVGEGDFTDYYHVFFPSQDHTLLCGNTAHSCFSTTFGEDMLQAGASGYVTLPTADAPGYWTLVNRKNLQPITLPELSSLTTSSLKSTSVLATVKLASNGNGTLSARGVLCSLQPDPTFDNSTRFTSSATGNEFSVRVNGLEPTTQYYLRAYVTNEKGTTLSDPVGFVTISKEEDPDTSFSRDDYSEDNAEGNSDKNSDIDKEEFGPDNNDDGSSNNSSIGKEDFIEDEEDNTSDNDSEINKEDFTEDENLDV